MRLLHKIWRALRGPTIDEILRHDEPRSVLRCSLKPQHPRNTPGRYVAAVVIATALCASPRAFPPPSSFVVALEQAVHVQRIEMVRAAYQTVVGETQTFVAGRVTEVSMSDRVTLASAFFETETSRRRTAHLLLTNARYARRILDAYYGMPF